MAHLEIVIADDNDEIREVLRAVLRDQQTMGVIAEAKTGHEVAALARKHKPDIVLMDVEMPGMDGFQALQSILQDRGETKVIMVTRKTSRVAVNRAQQLGAKGYVAKGDLHGELVAAIQVVAEGGSYLSESLRERESGSSSSSTGRAKASSADSGPGGVRHQSHSVTDQCKAPGAVEVPIRKQGQNQIRVFLVDDEKMVGDAVARTIHNESRFHFVGQGDEEEIVERAIRDAQPDIVLLDIYLGDHKRGGWGMMKRIRQVCPDTGIIIFTRSTGKANVSEAWRQDAAGYLNKGNWEEEGLQAMLAVHAGERFFPTLGEQSRNRASPTKKLSEAEYEIYFRRVRDVPSQAIAEERNIAVATVYVHRSSIKDKIGHEDGWRGIAEDSKSDPGLLCGLDTMEHRVFELYVQGTTVPQEIATKIGRTEAEAEVKDLLRSIRRKLNCHPDGWKGIAREEGDID